MTASCIGVLLALSAGAAPQLRVASGALWVGDAGVGRLTDVVLSEVTWRSSSELDIVLPVADGAATLSGRVRLDDDTTVLVSAPKPWPLQHPGGFRGMQRANAELVVLEHRAGGLSVEGDAPCLDPSEHLELPAWRAPSFVPAPWPTSRDACEPITVWPRPDEAADHCVVAHLHAAELRVLPNGWREIVLFSGAAQWRGFTREPLDCRALTIGHATGLEGTRFGFEPTCWPARLAPGTKLLPAPGAAPFVTVHRALEATACETDTPFVWELRLPAGAGTAYAQGLFAGSPWLTTPARR